MQRIRSRRITAAVTALSMLLAACATQPSNVQPAYVSSLKYDGYDCKRLLREAEEIDTRLRATTGTLQSKANTDAVLVGVGLLLFWPALLALPATGGKAEEAELAKLKGEAEALTRALKDRQCDVSKPVEANAPATVVPAVAPAVPAAVPAATPSAIPTSATQN